MCYHDRLMHVISINLGAINEGVNKLTQEILKVGENGGSIWLIGNGGSASTIEHFETDLSFVRVESLNSFPRVSALTANSSMVTATSNDISFDKVFSNLLTRKAQEGDLLISVSASGNSPNILNAMLRAKSQRIRTFSLLGFDGGRASKISDNSLVVLTQSGEYGIVEDIHLSICHAVSKNLLKRLTR